MSVDEAASQLLQSGAVVYAEPNYRVKSGQGAALPVKPLLYRASARLPVP